MADRRKQDGGRTQGVLSTHSPFIAAFPGATLLKLDEAGLHPTTLEETDHDRLRRECMSDWRGTVDEVLNG